MLRHFVAATALTAALPASAAVFDVSDFGADAFTYGAVSGGSISAFSGTYDNCFGSAGLQCQSSGGSSNWFGAFRSTTGSDVNFYSITLPAGTLMLHPGTATYSQIPGFVFTAPTAGLYTVDLQVFRIDNGSGGDGVTIGTLFDGGQSTLFDIGSFDRSTRLIQQTLQLSAGQTVGYYLHGKSDYAWDATGFSGTISMADVAPGGVPEPSAWTLMIAGFGLLGSAMRRRASVAFA